jgi:hypothetical protein
VFCADMWEASSSAEACSVDVPPQLETAENFSYERCQNQPHTPPLPLLGRDDRPYLGLLFVA